MRLHSLQASLLSTSTTALRHLHAGIRRLARVWMWGLLFASVPDAAHLILADSARCLM